MIVTLDREGREVSYDPQIFEFLIFPVNVVPRQEMLKMEITQTIRSCFQWIKAHDRMELKRCSLTNELTRDKSCGSIIGNDLTSLSNGLELTSFSNNSQL